MALYLVFSSLDKKSFALRFIYRPYRFGFYPGSRTMECSVEISDHQTTELIFDHASFLSSSLMHRHFSSKNSPHSNDPPAPSSSLPFKDSCFLGYLVSFRKFSVIINCLIFSEHLELRECCARNRRIVSSWRVFRSQLWTLGSPTWSSLTSAASLSPPIRRHLQAQEGVSLDGGDVLRAYRDRWRVEGGCARADAIGNGSINESENGALTLSRPIPQNLECLQYS
ncbi:hypothetical protein GYMLUDRAFT_249626 [Collybiopsis luxurians FD-317 M1]|uniref:Uncharacterized protein n=1 Tax=Collybiopsis luxurians FD-317 M1 TaxID=944289 RepID=A0A0D0CH73_9AGAR|nr:hypothetical protein GYMLUDRAFT_249626 [Collybiopsis luxurians FD-317 M1]